jgi:hypothetical protein
LSLNRYFYQKMWQAETSGIRGLVYAKHRLLGAAGYPVTMVEN